MLSCVRRSVLTSGDPECRALELNKPARRGQVKQSLQGSDKPAAVHWPRRDQGSFCAESSHVFHAVVRSRWVSLFSRGRYCRMYYVRTPYATVCFTRMQASIHYDVSASVYPHLTMPMIPPSCVVAEKVTWAGRQRAERPL